MSENSKNDTAYARLNKVLTKNSGLVQPTEAEQNIVLKGKSPEEVLKKYYEAQQGQYLKDNFYSVEKSFLQQMMHYEAQRLHAFHDYEGMEYYPLIASALDLYMEEATTIGDNGKMLNIYSKSPRIKKILEELFYDIININVNLPSWVRSMVKYGDNFVYLLPEKGKGITMVKQLLNMNMERKEDISQEGKLKIFFKKRENGQELSRIEVAHFRLLGDDKYLPYGASILNKIRKYWRMCLDENTEILTESGHKKIKDIKVNDIVYSYDYDTDKTVKTRVSKTMNNGIRKTYKVRSKFGEIILTDDHPILIKNKNGFEYKNILNIDIKKDYVVSPSSDKDFSEDNLSKIIEIREHGENNVYDIEIDHPTHNFIAENIVVHNCIMAEDAMLTYRILRAGDKRVYKIDVGNMAAEDIIPYMQETAKTLKRKPNINPENSNIDYRFNILGNDEDIFMPTRGDKSGTVIDTLEGACLSLDTKISLLDGRDLELSSIIDEFKTNKDLWTYSINPKSGEVVPGKITWAGVTRKNTEVIKLILDNDEEIIVTPDHKFPKKNGQIVEAKDLNVGDSLFSFNRKKEKINNKTKDYEMVYNHSNKKWIFTHRMVGNYMKKKSCHNEMVFSEKYKDNKKSTLHHINLNRFDNSPNNLTFMNYMDHFDLHSKKYQMVGALAWKEQFHNDEEFKKDVINRLSKIREEYYNNRTEKEISEHNKNIKNGIDKYFSNMNDNERQIRSSISANNVKRGQQTFRNRYDNEPEFKKMVIEKASKTQSITKKGMSDFYSKSTKKLWKENKNNFRERVTANQKTKYSEELLTIVVNLGKKHNLNFGKVCEDINSKKDNNYIDLFLEINKNNKQIKGKFNEFNYNSLNKLIKNFNYENLNDFKTNIKNYNHTIKEIVILEDKIDVGTITVDGMEEYHDYHNFALTCGVFTQNSNLNDINDIEYLRDMLFTGLGIPKPFLGYQNTAGDGKNVAQLDMRFAKKINRIQQAVIQELTNIAVIHLYMLGFEDEFSNFSLTLSPPSTQADILKTELLSNKATLYNEMTTSNDNGIAPVSHTWAKMNILNWSESEIIKDMERQFLERVVVQEIQHATQNVAKTGIFDDVMAKYGVKEGEKAIGNVQDEEEGGDGALGGGIGGGIDDIGDDMGGGMEDMTPDTGGGDSAPAFGESMKVSKNIIKELIDLDKQKILESSQSLRNRSKTIIDDITKDDNNK